MSLPDAAIHLCSSRAHAGLALLACAGATRPHDACILVDDSRGIARAKALGLRVDMLLTPPLRRPWLALRALRARLVENDFDQRTIIAWGSHLDPLVAATRGEQVVVDLDRGVIERFPGSLRGPGPIRTLAAPATPLPISLAPDARAAWRTRLGLEPDHRAIALVGVSPAECDVPAFVHVLGMLHFARVPVVGVVDRAFMSRHRAAMRRAREAMPNLRVLARDEPMLAWVGACDAAVLAPGDRFDSSDASRRFDPALLASTIAGAGVPIIAAEREVSDAATPRVIRVESAHPAIIARALREQLESTPAIGSALGANSHAARDAWRAALAAVADPPAISAIAGASA